MKRKLLTSITALLIGVACLVFLGTAVAREAIRNHFLSRDMTRLEQELSEKKLKGIQLSELLSEFNDPRWREEHVRRELNLKRPGETVLIIQGDEGGTVAGAQSAGTEIDTSNYKKWMRYFFGT